MPTVMLLAARTPLAPANVGPYDAQVAHYSALLTSDDAAVVAGAAEALRPAYW